MHEKKYRGSNGAFVICDAESIWMKSRSGDSTSSDYNRISMTPARIAELLQPFLERESLSPGQLSSISTYIDILTRWNARMNLTAIRDPEEIVTRHFGESLFAARYLFPSTSSAALAGESAGEDPLRASVPPVVKPFGSTPKVNFPKIADVGSGAGFPGLPIKLWAPHVSLTLIESHHKKSTFLREVVRALTLTDVNIQNARAESLPAHSFDVVTLRAVERFDAILPVAASLIADPGCLALLISAAQLPQLRTALPLCTISAPVSIPSSNSRVLAVAQNTPNPK